MNASTKTALENKVSLLNQLPTGSNEWDKVANQVELAIKNRLGKVALKKVS